MFIDFYIIRKNIYPSFLRRRMVGGGDPFYLKFWVNRPALERNRRFWTNNRSYSTSTVRPSEKSSIRKSPTRFPTSLRWSSYVAPKSPKGGSKKQNGRFPSIITILLKKVCYKVSLCENCQRQCCRAFTGLTIHSKIIGGDVPFYLKFWVKVTALERNRWFLSIFARSASAVTPSEKSSIITNRKSTTRFPMSPRWTSYVVSKPPKGGSKTQSV